MRFPCRVRSPAAIRRSHCRQVRFQTIDGLARTFDGSDLLDHFVAFRGRGEARPHSEQGLGALLHERDRHMKVCVARIVPAMQVDESLGLTTSMYTIRFG